MRHNKTFSALAFLIVSFFTALSVSLFGSSSQVLAASCSTTTVTVTRASIADFIIDTGNLDSAYVSYKINTGASVSFTDLWVKAEGFSDTTKLRLGTNEDGLYHVGPKATNTDTYVYFYLRGAATNTAQTYTLNLYNGNPTYGGTSTCTQSVSNTSVSSEIKAAANKVTSVVHSAPYIGGTMTITVTGQTGTMSSSRPEGSMFTYTAASLDAWPADCYELYDTHVSMTGGSTLTRDHGLIITTAADGLNSATSDYSLTYYMKATCTTAVPTSVTPVNYISSGGTNLKHTDTTTTTYTSIPTIPPAENRVVMSKSVSPGGSIGGGVATYTLTFTNTAPTSVTIDIIQDLMPSSPASPTYVNASTSYNGAPASNPNISGQQLTWTGNFSIPANSSRTMTYQTLMPSTNGLYTNSAKAYISGTQIDLTLATNDNIPATATYGVGDPNLAYSTKTVVDLNGGDVKPNDTLRYTVTVNNAGTVSATGVDVTDTIDTDTQSLTNVVVGALSTNCGVAYTNVSTPTQLTINNVSIGSGSTCVITFDVSVKPTAADNAAILNTATIGLADEGGVGGSASSEPLSVQLTPNLVVTKTENDVDNLIVPNQVVTYTITIDNTGETNAAGVDILDTVSGTASITVSNILLTGCGSVYVNNSSGLGIDIANVDVTTATNCVVTYDVTVGAAVSNGQIVNNNVDIGVADQGGNDPLTVNATTLTVGIPYPTLGVTKTENDADNIVTPGQTVTYTVTITNSGTGTGTTSFTDVVDGDYGTPSNYTYTSCGGTHSQGFAAPILTVSSLVIAPSTSCVVTYDLVVDSPLNEGTTLTNSADVAVSAEGGNNPSAVSATTLTVDATPILGATKTENDADNIVTPGQTVTYTITVSNTGNGQATGVPITDTVSANSTIQTGTVSLTNCGTYTNNTTATALDINGADINVSTNCVIIFDVIIASPLNEGTVIANSASVGASIEASASTLTPSSSNLTVNATPALSVTKTENDADNIVTPGQVVTYTVTITNTGNGAATTSFTDTIDTDYGNPSNFTYTNCGSPSQSFSAPTITVSSISVLTTISCVVSYDLTVDSPSTEGATLTNSADVTAATEGGNNPGAVPATTLTIDVTPNLIVNKVDNDADNIVTPGQVVTYTVTIQNDGNGLATTALTDAIDTDYGTPANFSYTGCGGTEGHTYSAPTLTMTNLAITTTSNCVITYELTVDNPSIENAPIDNSVDVASSSEGGNNPGVVSADTLTVNITPALSVSKTENDTDNIVTPGQTVTYAVTISNTGTGAATTSFTDSIDTDFGTPSNFTYTNCGGAYGNSYSSPTLAVSSLIVTTTSSCVVTYDLVVDSPITEGVTLINSADVALATEGGNNPSTVSATTLTVDGTPVLSVTAVENDSDDVVAPGQTVTYTITISNTGNTLASTELDTTLDDNLSDASNFVYIGCGSPAELYSAPSVSITGLLITTTANCVITFDTTVTVPATEDADIPFSTDVAPATEGGNDPAIATATTLTYDANDGIPTIVESDSPNSGDANNDGTNDSVQPDVTSFVNPVVGSYAVLENSLNCVNKNVSQVAQSSVANKDGFYIYPVGLMNFELVCGQIGATVTVTQYYYGTYEPSQLVARKYNSITHAYTTIVGAVIEKVTIDGKSLIKITYPITDGGIYDDDGVANGTIIDPVGPALLPSIGVPNTGYAPLSDNPSYGFVLLGLTIIAIGLASRRSRTSKQTH